MTVTFIKRFCIYCTHVSSTPW